jgi:hypothetical protein
VILFDGLADLVADAPETQAFQYELTQESRWSPVLRPHVHELYNSYRDALWVELEAAGLGGDALGHLVFSALDGLVFQRTCGVDEVPVEAALDELRRILVLLRERTQGTATTPDGV